MVEPGSTGRASHAEGATVFPDALSLYARCYGYWLDMRDRRKGWHIHYAIDTDVLITYMMPALNLKHGRIFGTDDTLAHLLVRILGAFIARELRGSATTGNAEPGCLLMISPHDEELHWHLVRLYEDLRRRTHDAPQKAEPLLRLFHANASDDEIADALIGNASEIMDLLDGRAGPLAAIEHFAALDRTRLLNIRRYRATRDDGTEFTFPTPPADARDPDFASFSERYGIWKDALERIHKKKSPVALRNDAVVLATLEWLNARIAGEKRRIVLITGSQSIFDAADYLTGKNRLASPETSFELAYLRHPQAFLGDDEFFAPKSESKGEFAKPFRVYDWLNLLLQFTDGRTTRGPLRGGEVEGQRASPERWDQLARELRKAAKFAIAQPDADKFASSFVSEWNEQIGTVAVKRGVALAVADPKSRAGKLVADLRKIVGRKWTVEHFRDYLTDRTRRSLITLYTSTAFLGVFVVRSEETAIRGVPALRFDTPYAHAQKICSDMQKQIFRGAAKLDLRALYDDLLSVDRDGYHALVVHAFAYGIRQHWFGTKTLCLMALEITDTLPEEERNLRTGREAAYLLAVAQRTLADTEQELESASEYLQLAQDRQTAGAGADPRFASEQLAIDVTVLYIQRFGTGNGRSTLSQGKLKPAVPILDAKSAIALEILESLRDEPLGEIRAWVTRQIFVSAVGLALMAEQETPGSTRHFRAVFPKFLAAFRAARLAPDQEDSYREKFSDIVYWTALRTFETQTPHHAVANKELLAVDPTTFGRDNAGVAELISFGLSRPGPAAAA